MKETVVNEVQWNARSNRHLFKSQLHMVLSTSTGCLYDTSEKSSQATQESRRNDTRRYRKPSFSQKLCCSSSSFSDQLTGGQDWFQCGCLTSHHTWRQTRRVSKCGVHGQNKILLVSPTAVVNPIQWRKLTSIIPLC